MGYENILRGERIILRPVREGEELERIRIWRNDPENARLFFTAHEITPEEHKRWFEAMKKADDRGVYAIALAESDEAIGSFNYRICKDSKEAVFGIMIGPEAERSKGFGKEAERLITEEMARRGAETAVMEVFSNNETAINFYKKIGYELDSIAGGRETQQGRPCDVHIMKRKIGGKSN